MSSFELPTLPEPLSQFIPYVANHPQERVSKLLAPYKEYESVLRKIYAQEPHNDLVKDNLINVVPVFAGLESQATIRARDLRSESLEEQEKYIMPLEDKDRRKNGSPAVVSSLKQFQDNFNIFSEGSLTDMDWNNVAACGSAVTTSLIPVPEQYRGSKKAQRKYYHEILAPASDIDLFIYGLDEKAAIKKMEQIEDKIKGAILHETTTIRTKNAITIASQYPTRHVQIVLRLYDSVSQILTGFDVDCSCVAYTGDQVYAAPRALASYITQTNEIDLSRRSPSYESRLSKYSHRGFEVYWSGLERNRIDPTIFERSFGRTLGLARLLVLERFPKTSDREAYMDRRRVERARPPKAHRHGRKLQGNLKDQEEDDIADWLAEEDVSSYTTVIVPYGPKYNVTKLNRLLYTRDLLLNAEWNRDEKREVNLHRHPCFFGDMKDVIQDCCGFCPQPVTEEEIEVAEEDAKRFVSGPISFLKDDPGRQEIGSFNPITTDDWTEMAYVGNTGRLCEAIVDGDLEIVKAWCQVEGNDVNARDYTGRTPLHLAVMVAETEIVQCLLDHGARMISRLIDGKTAIHIAAARGHVGILQALMSRSAENQEAEDARQDALKAAKKASKKADNDSSDESMEEVTTDDEFSDDDQDSVTVGSFIKVKSETKDQTEGVPEENLEDPDIIDVELTAWDYPVTALHLAIINGHTDMIQALVQDHGADVMSPVKLVNHDGRPIGAILNTVLALLLPVDKAKAVISLLLKLGASTAQADLGSWTFLHYAAQKPHVALIDTVFEHDEPSARQAMSHIAVENWNPQANTPLSSAIKNSTIEMVQHLFKFGASAKVEYDDWVKSAVQQADRFKRGSPEQNEQIFKTTVTQPIFLAVENDYPDLVPVLLANGSDPNTLSGSSYNLIQRANGYGSGKSLLDIVREKLEASRNFKGEYIWRHDVEEIHELEYYTRDLAEGSWRHFIAVEAYKTKKIGNERLQKAYETNKKRSDSKPGVKEKLEAVQELTRKWEAAEKALIDAGAKTFKDLYPDIKSNQYMGIPQWRNQEPEPFSVKIKFNIPDLNATTEAAYIRLYEAIWCNDLATVKQLTLDRWKSDQGQEHPPLKIAVQDNYHSPYSLAVLRGHFSLADNILEIALAQYNPDSKKRRWEIAGSDDEGSDSDMSDIDDSQGDNGIMPLRSHLIDEQFSIDHIGSLSESVRSTTSPLEVMHWACAAHHFRDEKSDLETTNNGPCDLFTHAIYHDDGNLLKYLLRTAEKYHALCVNTTEIMPVIPDGAFKRAILLGRTELLAEIIKFTGAGIPFETLMEKQGIKAKRPLGYYQGLTVQGKKRADWADMDRNKNHRPQFDTEPLIIQAARDGNLRSLQWFMDDEPLKCYMKFARTHKNSNKVNAIEESGIGFKKFISSWLASGYDDILHCVLLAPGLENYMSIIDFVVKQDPKLLEKRSKSGWTPLHSAVHSQRLDAIKYLLDAGADPRARDNDGGNIVHNTLVGIRRNATNDTRSAAYAVKAFELFDPKDIKEMCLERISLDPGALTPFAWYLQNSHYSPEATEVAKLIFKYTDGEDMDLMNGSGDLPLHMAVRYKRPALVETLISLRPDLLYRENSTGRTPLELASDIHLSDCMTPRQTQQARKRQNWQTPADHFDPRRKVYNLSSEETYDVCVRASQENHKKRKLVSLMEANEVARRLKSAKKWQGQHILRYRRRYYARSAGLSSDSDDYVDKWVAESFSLFH